jgi:hypothetical protein
MRDEAYGACAEPDGSNGTGHTTVQVVLGAPTQAPGVSL